MQAARQADGRSLRLFWQQMLARFASRFLGLSQTIQRRRDAIRWPLKHQQQAPTCVLLGKHGLIKCIGLSSIFATAQSRHQTLMPPTPEPSGSLDKRAQTFQCHYNTRHTAETGVPVRCLAPRIDGPPVQLQSGRGRAVVSCGHSMAGSSSGKIARQARSRRVYRPYCATGFILAGAVPSPLRLRKKSTPLAGPSAPSVGSTHWHQRALFHMALMKPGAPSVVSAR